MLLCALGSIERVDAHIDCLAFRYSSFWILLASTPLEMKSMTKNNVEFWIAIDRRFKKDKSEEDDPEEMGEALLGRIEFKLFDDLVPRAAKNFRSLASGEKGKGKSGKQLYYLNSPIHRVAAGKFIQGGDFIKGTGGYGESIFGGDFKDEAKGLKIAINRPGLLCMANGGKNSNTSQFFITLSAQPTLSGKHVVFGEIVAGMDTVEKIAAFHAEFGEGEEWKKAPEENSGEKSLIPFIWKSQVL